MPAAHRMLTAWGSLTPTLSRERERERAVCGEGLSVYTK